MARGLFLSYSYFFTLNQLRKKLWGFAGDFLTSSELTQKYLPHGVKMQKHCPLIGFLLFRTSEDVKDAFSNLINREHEERLLANGEQSLTRAKVESIPAHKGGGVSLIEVLDADTRLLKTRDTRARAQTEASRAAIASFRALGGGWEPYDLAKS
jgi:hypothetical protein